MNAPSRTEKISRSLWTILFIVALFIPVAAQITGWCPPTPDSGEKRIPKLFPSRPSTLAALRAWPTDFDEWFKDHFGLRPWLIHLHSRLLFNALRTSPQSKVLIGKDGWLYYNGAVAHDGDPVSDARGINPLTPAELETWRWMFQDFADWFAARRVAFFVAIVPGRETTYPEHLPSWMTRVGPETTSERAARYFKERASFSFIDLLPPLMEAKRDALAYRFTDTHWTQFGAYRAYHALLEQMGRSLSNLTPRPESDFTFEPRIEHDGDLAGMIGLKTDIPDHQILALPHQPPRAHLQADNDLETSDIVSTLDAPDKLRLLVIRDSFTSSLIPLISEHFRYVLYTWSTLALDMKSIQRAEPDAVLFIIGDRHLRRHLKYPTPIQEWAAQRRFERATNHIAGGATADDVARAIILPNHARAKPQGDGLHITTEIPNLSIELPEISNVSSQLPLIRVQLIVSGPCRLKISWASTSTVSAGETLTTEVSAPLKKGHNDIALPLVDPGLIGRPRLTIVGKNREVAFQSLEIRSIPR